VNGVEQLKLSGEAVCEGIGFSYYRKKPLKKGKNVKCKIPNIKVNAITNKTACVVLVVFVL